MKGSILAVPMRLAELMLLTVSTLSADRILLAVPTRFTGPIILTVFTPVAEPI